MELRKALPTEKAIIWEIIQQAIELRKQDGSGQWQNGYPNEQVVEEDIAAGNAYVWLENDQVIGYAAIIFGIEPAYNVIKGKWLTDNEDYVVIHRVAISNKATGKGLGTKFFQIIEDFCRENKAKSIKVDTFPDNFRMKKILANLGYTHCGEVFFANSNCIAYEKVLT